jgi:hypothetical protein
LPPYVIQKKHVDQVVKALDAALHKHGEFPQKRKHRKKRTAPPRRKGVHAHA